MRIPVFGPVGVVIGVVVVGVVGVVVVGVEVVGVGAVVVRVGVVVGVVFPIPNPRTRLLALILLLSPTEMSLIMLVVGDGTLTSVPLDLRATSDRLVAMALLVPIRILTTPVPFDELTLGIRTLRMALVVGVVGVVVGVVVVVGVGVVVRVGVVVVGVVVFVVVFVILRLRTRLLALILLPSPMSTSPIMLVIGDGTLTSVPLDLRATSDRLVLMALLIPIRTLTTRVPFDELTLGMRIRRIEVVVGVVVGVVVVGVVVAVVLVPVVGVVVGVLVVGVGVVLFLILSLSNLLFLPR